MKLGTIEQHLGDIYKRMTYLETVVRDLKYLAECNGWDFSYIEEKETLED